MTDVTVSGRFKMPDGWQTFETELTAPNEDVAVEHVYSTLGSRHALTRPQIEIEEVST